MSIFFITDRMAAQAEEDALWAARNSAAEPPPLFDFTEGVLKPAGRAVTQLSEGAANVGGWVANLPNVWLETPDYLLPSDPIQRAATRRLTDPHYGERTTAAQAFDSLVRASREARETRYLRPSIRAQSEATNLIAGLVETLTPALIAGAVNPAAVIPALGAATYARSEGDLIDQGVAPDVASQGALQDSYFMMAMGAAPIAVPGRLFTRAVSGAGINLAFGAAMRGNMNNYLTEQGYGEGSENNLAQHYQWMDRHAMVLDALLGATLGVESKTS